MKVITVGCGRVGARVAAELDTRGEHVTGSDISPRAFGRLPPTVKGETVRGNGTDEDVVRAAGGE
ncbi:MAG: NAD-binding protein, partial [Candidatus Limnocylindria bacterium]